MLSFKGENRWGLMKQYRPIQFQDCIPTVPPLQAVRVQKIHKDRHEWGRKGVKSSTFKTKWKTSRPWLERQRVEHDSHEHPGGKIETAESK